MCPQLHNLAAKAAPNDTDIAKAFQAQCHVTTTAADWFVITGATDHMAANTGPVLNATLYTFLGNVTFANGHKLPITHTSSTFIFPNIQLYDVLVFPNIQKNLLSVSKLTLDNHLDVLFSNQTFTFKTARRNRCWHKEDVRRDSKS